MFDAADFAALHALALVIPVPVPSSTAALAEVQIINQSAVAMQIIISFI